MLRMKRFTLTQLLVCHGLIAAAAGPVAFAKGLDDMPPPVKGEHEIEETTSATPAPDGLTPKAPEAPADAQTTAPAPKEEQTQDESSKLEPVVEPGRAERFLNENLVIGTSINMVWPTRDGSGWKPSGSGRTGSSDLLIGVNVPNSALGLRKSKKFNLKGTFRYSPVVVAGTQKSKPYRGVWEGYHAGLEGHLKYPRVKGMTVVAGVEAGLVFVYLDALDDFQTPTSAEATGTILTAHAGGDWEVAPNIRLGPRVYLGFGGFQNYQIGAATNFAF